MVSNSDKWPSDSRSVQKSKFTTLSSQYKVKMKNNDPLVSVQGQTKEQQSSRLSTRSKSRTTTLSSQYKVKIKNNYSLVSVQGQNKEQRPSRLSTRSKSRTKTLSSQYNVKMKNNDPLLLVQGQFKSKIYNPLISEQGQVRDPLVSVQSLGLYLYIYFIVFYSHNRTKLVFLSLLIFYSDNLNFISSNHIVKF